MTISTVTMGDGCTLAYRLDGPAGAPLLLLSNSLGTDMSMWAPQMGMFARDFRILRYDSRGHGRSGVPVGSYAIDRLGRDVIELLDALEIDKVDFCGLSLGGMIGQWLGIREALRLRRLVVANTSSYMGPPSGWDVRIATGLSEGIAPLADASVERWFTREFATAHVDAVLPIRDVLLSTNPQGYVGCCAAIRDMDMRRTAQLIRTPTLVIGGRLDPATPPPHSEALVAAIPDAALIMLEAAHLSNVEQPSAFAKAVLSHLTS